MSEPHDGTPIIRLTIDRMKYSMLHSLSAHTAQMDKDLEQAVEQFCKPENLRSIIFAQAHAELRKCVEKAVERFFWNKDAQEIVNEIVRETLRKAFAEKGAK